MAYHYPPGWAPPFRGAAPPMPAHLSISQQQWQMGSWQFNPAYNYQRHPAPQTQWMAASAWGAQPAYRIQPNQPPANFNPYKKVIKPPSAEYLANPLVANSLNLHDMVPKNNPYGDEEDPNVPKTPWIWNPKTLQNDAPSVTAMTKTKVAKEAEARERLEIRQSSEPLSSYNSAPPSTSAPRHATDPSSSTSWDNNSSPLKPTFSPKIVRTPQHYSQSNASTSSLNSVTARMDHLTTRDREPSQLGRHSSMPSITGSQISDEPMEYLSPLPISFNPLEKMTPSRRPLARGTTHPEISSYQPLNTITEAPTYEESTRHGSSSHARDASSRIRIYADAPTVQPQTAPASQDSFHRPPHNRTESYPISASIDRPFARDYSSQSTSNRPTNTRSESYPSFTSHDISPQETHTQRPSVIQQHTPPESNNSDPYPTPTRRPRSPPHTSSTAATTPRRPIEIYAPSTLPQRSYSYPHPHRSSQPSSQESSPSYSSSTTSTSTPRHSPPEPAARSTSPSQYPITPVSIHRHGSAPVSGSAPVYEDNRPAPVKPRRTYHPVTPFQPMLRRKGFWNRRGDHCTQEGYLVCAPYDETYPEELASYPENEYQDHFGFRIAFEPTRPELPESLPKYGMPPQKPYKDFLVYTE